MLKLHDQLWQAIRKNNVLATYEKCTVSKLASFQDNGN